jgi:putative PIN family toxin of toxin-antitoxin system
MNFVLRVVLDTNILVSAALKPESLQRTIFLVSLTRAIRLYVSQPILDEYAAVLARPKFGIRRGARMQMLQLIKNHTHLVVPKRTLSVTSDPDDNIFVECDRQSEALPDLLEEHQGDRFPRLHPSRSASSSRVERLHCPFKP